MEINMFEFLAFGEEFLEIITQSTRQIAAIILAALPLLLIAFLAPSRTQRQRRSVR